MLSGVLNLKLEGEWVCWFLPVLGSIATDWYSSSGVRVNVERLPVGVRERSDLKERIVTE